MKLTNEQLEHYRERFVTTCELITAAKVEFNNANFFNSDPGKETVTDSMGFEISIVRNPVGSRFIGRKFYGLVQSIGNGLCEVYGEMSRKNARNRRFFYAIEDENAPGEEIIRWEWSKDEGLAIIK